MLTNKQTNAAKIKSTNEIYKIIAKMEPEEYQNFNKQCNIYAAMIRPKIEDLSNDIIIRITLSEKILPKGISLENINSWMNEAVKAEQNRKVKKAYMAFAKNVKVFYEKCNVEWTQCKPNNIIRIEKELSAIKKIQVFNSDFSVNGKPTGKSVIGMLTGGQIEKIPIEIAKQVLDPPR